MVTTVDHLRREPVGVTELAAATGLAEHLRIVTLPSGYNHFLLDVLGAQTRGGACKPCYDFCFLDGAHLWEPDALAAQLVVPLLRPGGWLLLDDLNWRPKDHPGWETAFKDMSPAEQDAMAVGLVYDLLLRTRQDLERFVLTNDGHMGWCRKVGPPTTWLPGRILAGARLGGAWSELVPGARAVSGTTHSDSLSVTEQGLAVMLRSTGDDPHIHLNTPAEARPLGHVTLRLRLVGTGKETTQLFWIGLDDDYFNEDRSLRCIVRASPEAQDVTFLMAGTERDRTLRGLRFDPANDLCEMLLESVTFGG
jgi:hypothetical protein